MYCNKCPAEVPLKQMVAHTFQNKLGIHEWKPDNYFRPIQINNRLTEVESQNVPNRVLEILPAWIFQRASLTQSPKKCDGLPIPSRKDREIAIFNLQSYVKLYERPMLVNIK